MKTLREIKEAAAAALDGKWGKAALATLLLTLIAMALDAPYYSYMWVTEQFEPFYMPTMDVLLTNTCISSGSTLVSIFVSLPLVVGINNTFKLLYRKENEELGKNMFRLAFCGKRYWRNVGVMVLIVIYGLLWSLLLIIPGIIKAYSYAMAPFIIQDNPGMGCDEAIEESMDMMNGYKWKLFVLDLSFIGWFLLCLISAGIGFFWLQPYVETSHAAFYQELLEKNGK